MKYDLARLVAALVAAVTIGVAPAAAQQAMLIQPIDPSDTLTAVEAKVTVLTYSALLQADRDYRANGTNGLQVGATKCYNQIKPADNVAVSLFCAQYDWFACTIDASAGLPAAAGLEYCREGARQERLRRTLASVFEPDLSEGFAILLSKIRRDTLMVAISRGDFKPLNCRALGCSPRSGPAFVP